MAVPVHGLHTDAYPEYGEAQKKKWPDYYETESHLIKFSF